MDSNESNRPINVSDIIGQSTELAFEGTFAWALCRMHRQIEQTRKVWADTHLPLKSVVINPLCFCGCGREFPGIIGRIAHPTIVNKSGSVDWIPCADDMLATDWMDYNSNESIR